MKRGKQGDVLKASNVGGEKGRFRLDIVSYRNFLF